MNPQVTIADEAMVVLEPFTRGGFFPDNNAGVLPARAENFRPK